MASLPEITTPLQSGLSRRRNAPRLTVVAASSVAAVGIGIAVWWAWPKGNPAAVPVQEPVVASVRRPSAPVAEPLPRLSIVVLPFANLSSDPDQEYFVDGITDDLTTDLSRISGSFVIARNTAFTYKGKPVDATQIGRELRVRYVLEGSVRRAGDKIQVNVQLIDATTGGHLWADRFDTERANLAAAQAQITGRLAQTLGVELIRAEERRIEADTVSPDARDLVMRGWAWSYKTKSAATQQQQQRFFEQAIEIDRCVRARTGNRCATPHGTRIVLGETDTKICHPVAVKSISWNVLGVGVVAGPHRDRGGAGRTAIEPAGPIYARGSREWQQLQQGAE